MRRRLKRVRLLSTANAWALAAWLSTAPASAQAPPPADRSVAQYLRQHWSLEEGLPQVGVGDLVQDRQGFLWVGTQDGLARFDGLDFEVFRRETTPGLAGNSVTRLEVDDRGALWVGTRSGLSRFDGGTFATVSPRRAALGQVHGLTPLPGGGVLVSSDAGLFRATGSTLEPVGGVAAGPVFFAEPQEDGSLLVGLSGAVAWTAPSGLRRLSLASFGEGVVPKLVLRGCGAAWVGTTVGLLSLGGASAALVGAVGRRNVNDLYCDAHGTLWVATGSGLIRLRGGRVIERLDTEAQFPHPFITAFLAGDGGSLWVGTLTGGLYRLTLGRYVRYGQASGLPFAATFAVAEAGGGGLWIGGQGGVARLRGARVEAVRRLAGPHAPRDVVTALLEDSSGRLWVGTRSELTWTHLASGQRRRVLDSMVFALTQAPDDTIWIGADSGLYRYRGGVVDVRGAPDGLTRVRSVLVSARYGLLVGTERGVFAARGRWPDGRDGFDRFDDRVFPGDGRVGALFEDAQGDVWVAYLGDGLARRSAARGTWTLYREQDGLLSNTVYGVRVGHDGRYWISTQRGVVRIAREAFDRVEAETPAGPTAAAAAGARPALAAGSRPRLDPDVVVSVSGREPGASPGYCCNGGAASSMLLTAEGALWLPSLDGVVRVDTAAARASHAPPRVVLLALRHGAASHRYDPAVQLRVPARERDLEFVFTAPVFDQPALVRFHYRLDGYDEGWKQARGRRTVSYTNLRGGRYTFRIAADRGDGSDPGPEAAWTLTIEPRVTEQWWFYLLLGPLALAGVYGLMAARLKRLEAQRARLERQVAERTAELAEANAALTRANAQLLEQSYTDPLTHLHNRRYLVDRIEQDLARVHRLRARPGAGDLGLIFMLVDLDRFKRINDVHGHDAGDAVLVEAARRLKGLARQADYLVRWGGEEFLLVNCFGAVSGAPQIAERVVQALASEPVSLPGGQTIGVTGSLGFSVYPLDEAGASGAPDPRAWEAVVALADQALYLVKQRGGNGWAGFVRGPGAGAAGSLTDLARALDAALARGAVVLVTSPAPGRREGRAGQ